MILKRFNKVLKPAFYLLLLLVSTNLLSQDCKQLILNYIAKVSSFNRPVGSKVYYLHIGVRTTFWNTQTPVQNIDAKIFLTKNAYFYDSSPLSIYNDPTDLIYLNHINKQIILSQSKTLNDQLNSVDQLLKMQQEIIQDGSITSCADTVINSLRIRKIFLYTSPAIRSKMRVTQIEYQYLPETEMIKNVTIFYEYGHLIKWQTIEYKDLDFDYKQWSAIKARSMVFDNSGRINSKYIHYSLIDNRK